MKILKYALLGLAACVLVLAAAAAWLVYTFDARDYYPQIVDFAAARTGRTLQIHGGIDLTFRPDPVLRLARVTLTERDNTTPFVDVEEARVGVRLRPLLSKSVVADQVSVTGAHVRLARDADGRLNIDDLMPSGGGDLAWDIAGVKVERSAVSYRDLAAGREYALTGIALQTGRLANALPTPVSAGFQARDGGGALDAAVGLKGRLTFDLAQQTYALDAATLAMSGRVPAIDDLTLQVTGDFRAAVKTLELRGSAVAAKAKLNATGEPLDVVASAGSIVAAIDRARAETVSLGVSAAGAAGTTRIALGVPVLEHAAQALRADAAHIELDLNRGGHAIRASMTGNLDADLHARVLALNGLEASFTATGAQLPPKGLAGTLGGDARVDLAKENVHAKLTGKLPDSRVTAQVSMSGFAAPVYAFDVSLDRLDVDRYRVRTTRGAAPATALDLSALESLPATGTLRIGALTAGGVKARGVTLAVKR